MVAIFSSRCSWRSSLCSNLEGIDPEKREIIDLCQATLKNVYMVCSCLGKGLYILWEITYTWLTTDEGAVRPKLCLV